MEHTDFGLLFIILDQDSYHMKKMFQIIPLKNGILNKFYQNFIF